MTGGKGFHPAPEAIDATQIAEAHRITDEKAIEVAFQQIVDLRTGEIFAYEALSRSPSDIFESVPQLYAAASRAGRVGDLGRLHREQAIAKAPPYPLFINVNPNEFDYGWLVRPDDPIYFRREPVYLEITESAPLSHFQQCRNVLDEVRKNGILLAIDDFGAGYSNLKYIADLSPEVVKLDRELISEVRNGTRSFRLLDSIVHLCRAMGAKIVAEGIETIRELSAAQHTNVDYGQGYLFGRPARQPKGVTWSAGNF